MANKPATWKLLSARSWTTKQAESACSLCHEPSRVDLRRKIMFLNRANNRSTFLSTFSQQIPPQPFLPTLSCHICKFSCKISDKLEEKADQVYTLKWKIKVNFIEVLVVSQSEFQAKA